MGKSNRSEWRTPPVFVDLVVKRMLLTVDVCATKNNSVLPVYITPEMDALSANTRWCVVAKERHVTPRFYCNPPYDDVMPWINACFRHTRLLGAVAFLLLHDNFSAPWFEELMRCANEIWLLQPRIAFLPPPDVKESTNSRSSMLAVFGLEGSRTVPNAGREKSADILCYNWKAGKFL